MHPDDRIRLEGLVRKHDRRVDDIGPDDKCIPCGMFTRNGYTFRLDADKKGTGTGLGAAKKHLCSPTHSFFSDVRCAQANQQVPMGQGAPPAGTVTPALDSVNASLKERGEEHSI